MIYMICNRMYNTVECVLYMKRGLYEGLFLTIFNSIYFLLLRLILHVYRIGTYPNTVWPSELDRRHFFSFTTTTMQQRNRSSRTKKRRKIFRSRCLDGVATANIVIWPENIVTLSRQYCRVPSSAHTDLIDLLITAWNVCCWISTHQHMLLSQVDKKLNFHFRIFFHWIERHNLPVIKIIEIFLIFPVTVKNISKTLSFSFTLYKTVQWPKIGVLALKLW